MSNLTKLTLSMDRRAIAKAKRLAKARGTSVSAMLGQIVRNLDEPEPIGPVAAVRTASSPPVAAAPEDLRLGQVVNIRDAFAGIGNVLAGLRHGEGLQERGCFLYHRLIRTDSQEKCSVMLLQSRNSPFFNRTGAYLCLHHAI